MEGVKRKTHNNLDTVIDSEITKMYEELKQESNTYEELRQAIKKVVSDYFWQGKINFHKYLKKELINRLEKDIGDTPINKDLKEECHEE